jgi:hypothetical protein
MRARRELVTAACHVKVRPPVPVRIEESGAPDVKILVSLPRLPLGSLDEAAVLVLDEQFAGGSR